MKGEKYEQYVRLGKKEKLRLPARKKTQIEKKANLTMDAPAMRVL